MRTIVTNGVHYFVNGFRVVNPGMPIRDWRLSRRPTTAAPKIKPCSWYGYFFPESAEEAWAVLAAVPAMIVAWDTAKISDNHRTIWVVLDRDLSRPGAMTTPQKQIQSRVDFLGLAGQKTAYLGDWLFFDGGKTRRWVFGLNGDQASQIVLSPEWALAWTREKPGLLVDLKKLHFSGFGDPPGALGG